MVVAVTEFRSVKYKQVERMLAVTLQATFRVHNQVHLFVVRLIYEIKSTPSGTKHARGSAENVHQFKRINNYNRCNSLSHELKLKIN